MRWLLVVVVAGSAGCWTEGNSFFLGSGETERFLTMDACLARADARYEDGQPQFGGYRCQSLVLGFNVGAERRIHPKR